MQPVKTPEQVVIVGCIGLFLNIVSVLVVHDHGGHSHSHSHDAAPAFELPERSAEIRALEGAHALHHHASLPPSRAQPNLGLMAVLVHLFGDAVNNVGVIMAGIIIWKVQSPNRFYADPAVSLAISFVIFASAIPTTIKSGRILLEAAPIELDLAKVQADLLALDGVLAVHDLHVWMLSQSLILASLHVCVPPGTSLEQWEKTEQSLQHCFSAYGVNHVTMSPEVYRPTRTPSSEEMPLCNSATEAGPGCAVNILNGKSSLVKRPHSHALKSQNSV